MVSQTEELPLPIFISPIQMSMMFLRSQTGKQVATADWENNSDEKNVTFSPETAKHIRIEVKHSAGDQTDAFINAAAIGIYKAEEVVAEDKVISKPVLTAVAPVTQGRHLLT